MESRKELQIPENPSERFPLMPIVFRCNHCGQNYTNWKQFLDHMEKSSHRICYKCGQSCGGMEEYLHGEYVAITQIEGRIESWKYKHISCPFSNPSKRKRSEDND
jgi:hypothetical protein